MKVEQVQNCIFSSWYPNFRCKTFKSKILDLGAEVVNYLLSDGIVLPEGCEDNWNTDGLDGYSDDEVNWEDEDEESPLKAPDLSIFTAELKQAIEDLGGEVFPKLNWSSPKDAVWISLNKSLKCTCPRDIYLLLKSSDFIMHDMTEPFKYCDDVSHNQNPTNYQLTLRQWQNIDPASEFRCFVVENQLKGICQRNHTSYFPYIDHNKDVIKSQIQTFYQEHILEKFPDSSYVFDIQSKDGDIMLVDFNPFGQVTDPLLFSFAELVSEDATYQQGPMFRFVDKLAENKMMPHQYACYSMPQDFVHLASGEDPNKLADLLSLKCRAHNQEDASDDDDNENNLS